MQKTLRIAVQVETSRAHGRAMLEGIASAALDDDAAIAARAADCFAEHRYMRCAYCGLPGLRFSAARGEEFARLVEKRGAECGYPSAQYFAHRFSAEFGITPDVWRRSQA